MGDEAAKVQTDVRLNFLEDYIMRIMQIKKDKWTKMITTEELRDMVIDFIEDPKRERLMFYMSSGGSLTPCTEFPHKLRTKLTYIIRTTTPLMLNTTEDILNECIMGDLLPNTMETFSSLIDNVFIPILQSPENQEGWTQIMSKDMRSECQSLRNYIAQMQGHMINKTILNLPICIDEVMAISPKIAAGDTSVLSTRNKDSLEGIVVKWFDSVIELIHIKAADKVFEHDKHPLPSQLFSYWQTRLENIEDLTQQLGTAQIKTIGYVLESIDSVFVRQFKNMVHDILKALVEARDVIANLTPLKKFLDKFEGSSLEDNRKNIRPLLLVVTLVWANSKYFSTTDNMSLLFILVNNSLLDSASRLLEADTIFQGEIDEAYNKCNLVIDICNHYRQTYEDIRQNLDNYKSPTNKQAQDWTWQPKTIFGYMDEYIDRVHELQEMFETGIDFIKLEKVNFGAFRGRQITTAVDKIYDEFNQVYHEWDNIQFNPMELDANDKNFCRTANKYNSKIDILERKLAFQFEKALDDSHDLSLSIYLVELLGTLLHRPIIKQQTYGYLVNILHKYAEELDTIKLLYDENVALYKLKGIKDIPVDKNLTPISGILMWIAEVRHRTEWPYKEFPYMEFPDLFKNELGEDILKRYHEMMNYLSNFESLILKIWKSQCTKDITNGMKKPLLRMDDGVLFVNFDNELKIALKDIKNIKLLELRVPSKLAAFFDREEELWTALLKLMRITEWYNDIYDRSEPCELDLIIGEMENINNMLNPSLNTITYNNFEQNYIDECYDTIHNVHRRLVRTQLNLDLIRKNIRAWGDIPLYERKNSDDKELLYVDDRIGVMEKRYMKCIESKNLINIFVNLNFKLFFNLPEVSEWLANIGEEDESTRPFESVTAATQVLVTEGQIEDLEHQPSMIGLDNMKEVNLQDTEELLATLPEEDKVKFRTYLDYVDSVVGEELINAITNSIKYLKSEMEKPNTPLFEIVMELENNDVIFILSIDISDFYGFYNHVEEITEDIYRMAAMMTKINDPDNTYSDILTDSLNCFKMKNDIFHKVKYVLTAVKSHYINEYEDKSYIWKEDKQKYLFEFKKYGHALDEIERENLDGPNAPVPLKEDYPPLSLYKEQMDRFIALYDDISKTWKESHDFSGWLRLNKKLFKASVLVQVNNWFNLFRDDLVTRVKGGLQELDDFITEALQLLKIDLDKDDFEGLLKIMAILNKINEKQLYYDSMFEPFRDIVELLKSYNYQFEEKVFQQFNELPDQWLKVKKMASVTKQMIIPIQAYQVDLIEKRIILYDNYASTFRRKFLSKQFFQVPCPNVYDEFDATHLELFALESQYQHLKDSAALFELPTPDRTKIDRCRSELQLLKQLWDFVIGIESTIDDWRKTPWKKIDIENMDSECKKFGKDLRTLKPECRVWQPYIYSEASLKNLMTSLRAVTELQNPAIRDRHWAELMKQTNIKIDMGDSTTLANLLDLNLQNYEEEVKNIVDKAVKEQAMEKFLRELQAVWSNTSFGTENHERTGLQLLQVSEEVIETLEDHQGQLQNLLGSKYIAYFYDEVSNWQNKLANADQVISSWFEVQRKWQYLESIFIGSEDIRSQLPEDSKRFDGIDTEFKNLLGQMTNELNVVRATNRGGLYEKLENLEKQLILCEKALNDYLETKRLSYPRFYFVSSADLLDILSNGNNPIAVSRHLTKLYDSLGKLAMIPNTKAASGMIAKELEELVPFIVRCDCSGKVEVWLNRVTDAMRDTLRDHFRRSVIAYEEKPRHVWIFEWPAQPALVATQIWWTAETNDAFAKLDLGYENALKDENKKQINQLNALITILLADLTPGERQKIMTVCTIDVHSRDVVGKMIAQKIELASAFQWQSQLRHRWDLKIDDCFGNICDAQFRYDYEYLGNTPRLVITPLTDRCYITLTQSLHLVMGGAPAGPAGTGKTETTKDLGKAIGMMVYVFNCSEQMDYKSIGNIHKGLAQTGAWGCFDEFNRISVEVLSVVAVQVKTIQDAIKTKKIVFNFTGEIIKLRPTVGLFITMNPGYAGRAELPENLKALYRPCAMVVPDFALICEIMLVAEGFQEARLLARKFITLYTLCKELLSKQDHYDWGLRAIKSVLVVAGALRRGDRLRPEDQVLMRALRDFNIPKIVTDDVPVFMGLIGDLFPALNVPRKRLLDFEAIIKQSALDLKLQPEEGFILKVVQLEELFAVRHSVFIIGFAGTGKSEVWKTLNKTYSNQKRRPFFNDLNPKAVTNDELFGIVNPSTREWKDGLFSIIMRDQANLSGNGPKWIVLDGDIDPMWIESLNTVMDDNKVLTLASNERIALTKEMRLLFEISNLRTATPATVSRAGILYINPQDLGWSPFILSWINTRQNKQEHPILLILFDKYVPALLDAFKSRLKKITPISEIAMLQMTCFLLDCCLTPQNTPYDCPKDWYEIYFVFSIVWGFGSTLFQDQIIDWRNEFHKWWINEFKTIRFPTNGTIFSFYVDQSTKKWLPWTTLVPDFELNPDIPLQSNLVNTSETTRLRYFMDILTEDNHPIMLVGPAGSGKTIMMNAKLNALPDRYAVTNVPFNFYTTSEMLQRILEKPLEKKAGRNFGPPSGKKMIYFVDDMNMPEVDKYGTVQPHTIIRQFMDYGHWYDRTKMTLKDIHNCQFVSAMNPTAGSFTIDPRLQRHFCSFAVNEPSADALYHILNSILSQHMENPIHKFKTDVIKLCDALVQTAIILHQRVSSTFLPTAIKFHYNFNLRDISNIFTGMLYSNSEICPNTDLLIRLWVHESSRVYGDKLVEIQDIQEFQKCLIQSLRKGIETFNEDIVLEKPLIYCHFAKGLTDMKYGSIKDWALLLKLLTEAQSEYNELVGAMNLVLFEDAMSHICRISRIIESSRGYALLIGVGGSGKQSLSRLAAYISSLDVFQIQLTKDYSLNDLRINISTLYTKAGVKSTPCCFLLTDSEVPKEQFLVLVNDLLASGEIHELFADDEVENIIGNMRNEAKQEGIPEVREAIWKYFIEKVRALLKVILCFSPVGATLRIRSRKFPALVNNTTIDWFHEWPQEALESVSFRFLSEIEVLEETLCTPISKFMAFVHTSVNKISQLYLANDRRYNYTTPKSFLELISLYTKLLEEKIKANKNQSFRLSNGLIKLASCSVEADSLQDVLKDQEVILKVKNEAADQLIKVVSFENEKVSKERAYATEEERKVRTIEEEVSVEATNCEEDYRKVQPALLAAQEALNTLNKNNLTELKSFGAPPEAVVNCCAAVLVLFSPKGKVPKDRSWKAARVMMGNVDQFLRDLIYYDKEHIHLDTIKALQPYIKDPEFDPEKIIQKSGAAAGLCSWVININKFHEVWLVVEPKIRALTNAQNTLQAAREKLTGLQAQLNRLEEELSVIQLKLDGALGEKQKCQDEADKTAFTIDLANRLINGLASNKKRWQDSVSSLKGNLITLPGDILLLSCFISYVGCFTRVYRTELQQKQWWPQFKSMDKPIPASGGDPFEMICDDAQIAEWNNQGLPSDRMSAENAAILIHSQRFPLMIDPQLQGIKWVKTKYAKELIVLRLTQRGYLDQVEKAISNGNVLLIENIGENVDAVLNPVLGRNLIKKGTCVKMGDREIDYNPKFRLILHTKLANPHYKPEMQAQTTLINFTVTRDGLEDQLLGEVVKAERPDLAALRAKLTQQQNNFKITLKFLEDDLLKRLAAAGDNVLEDVTLVMNLEKTKRTSDEVEIKVVEAAATAIQIDAAREFYRPAAERASIIYFILNDLFKINPIYQFSLKAFTVVFTTAIDKAEPADSLKERVNNLIESLTFTTFMYTARGLFEADKLIFLTQMATQIFLNSGDIKPSELDFLLRYPYTPNLTSPCPFLTSTNWGGIKALSDLEEFRGLDKDIESSMKRWKSFTEFDAPEKEKLPGEWKTKTSLQRLCIMRALRPDRMTYAIQGFIQDTLGPQFIGVRMLDFPTTFEESSAETHVFFVLSAGVDPLKDVEKLGKVLGFTMDLQNLHNVSLGQGQETIAENAIRVASTDGHWVILQNIHLVARWLPVLEKSMEATLGISHPDYRLYLSAEPAGDPAYHILPQGILESAIKITNEPPTGMLQNVHKALDNFTQETLEMCTKETEFKAILFSLCYFHAVIAERRKFGAQGWNRVYPFNVGDLTISVYVLYNYLEANNRVPWEDLRYLFGEIMYGGHITDDWDRRLCRTYLEEFMQPELIDGELFYCKGFPAPGILDYNGYHLYIDDNLPSESPHLYGLHLNAEIGYLTTVAERLFRIVFELQPRMAGGAAEGELTQEEMVKLIIEDILDKISAPFNIPELMSKTPDRNPYIIVSFQECERMNALMGEISRSLKELELGLKGELTISSLMEHLMQSLFLDQVPESWTKLAYPSLLGIQSWFADLLIRLRELEAWVADFRLPSSVWLGGFFNPQSFLTAIMQQTARKNEWPLDRMCLNCDVTKKTREEISQPPREGAYVNGLYMEGARWDTKIGSIADAFMKDLFPMMPVMFIKAITQDKQDTKNIYECPVYKIRGRGPTYVWTFNLKTKEKASKWTLAGVCLLLQP